MVIRTINKWLNILSARVMLLAAFSLATLFFITGCDSKSGVTVLKMSHSLPTDHPVHGGISYMATRLAELSGGKMRVDIYAGGQLGSEREQIELLQIGSLAMTKVSSSPMESFVPEMKVFSLPYVFRDAEHFWRALKSDLGKQLLLSGESVGLRGLGYYDAGARSFYSVDKPINSPADLEGLKVRVQNSNTSVQMVRALGGSGTPIAFGELYTALDQGVVDGAENNPPSFVTSGHFEVAKYYSLTEHTYVPDIVLISSYIWNRLTEQEQDWLQQAMDESIEVQRELWKKSTAESLQTAQNKGVAIIYPDKTKFAEKVNDMLESLQGDPSYDVKKAFRAM